jgi:hypothetical protein
VQNLYIHCCCIAIAPLQLPRMVANSLNMQTAFVAAPSKACSQSRGSARLSTSQTPNVRVAFSSSINGQRLLLCSQPTSRTERAGALRVCAIKDGAVLDRKLRVAVIGGGPSGACTAETLAAGGIETFLIERKLDNCKVGLTPLHVYVCVLLDLLRAALHGLREVFQCVLLLIQCICSKTACCCFAHTSSKYI